MSENKHTPEQLASAESDIVQQRTDELKAFKLPCDINFVNGSVGKGCSLYTLQLRILNHGEALRDMIRIAENQRDELLEALEYHQAQTRPIQRTIDAIASAKSINPVAKESLTTETSAPAIVFYPAGSLGEYVESEGGES